MTRILFIILLFGNCFLSSQTLQRLEEKRGYKDFKLGDSYLMWQKKLTYVEQDKNKICYKYTGECCHTVFDYKTHAIFLSFSKNKLVEIEIVFSAFQDHWGNKDELNLNLLGKDYEKIVSHLKAVYGEPQDKKYRNVMKDGLYGLTSRNVWEGKATLLRCDYYVQRYDDEAKIIIQDKQFFLKETGDGF